MDYDKIEEKEDSRMEMFIYGLLAGMGVYWLICGVMLPFIEFESERNMVLYGIFGGGIVWIMWLVMFIIRRCSNVIKKKRYKALVIDEDSKEIYYADSAKTKKFFC